MNQTHYTIHGINGPVVKVTGGKGLAMMDMVSVGEEGLIGEVVSVDRSATTVQVYEDTAGLKPGQPVVSQGAPMAITLGPGMLTNIFDGIARPLKVIEAESGPFIGRGLNIPSLDQEKTWDVTLHVKAGDVLAPGALYASCPETPLIVHRCLVPPAPSPSGCPSTGLWSPGSGSSTPFSPSERGAPPPSPAPSARARP